MDKHGKNEASLRYFKGARNQYSPSLSNIGLFLQRDVDDMELRTGGSARYFQHAIKRALENNAEMTAVTFSYDGRTIKGTEIKITPYRHDPHRDALQQYARKYYVFTLSEAVPGEVYELRTTIPSQSGQSSSAAQLEARLTFSGIKSITLDREAN